MPNPDKEPQGLAETLLFPATINTYAQRGFFYALRQGWIGTRMALKKNLFNREYPSGIISNCYQLTTAVKPSVRFFILVEQLAKNNYLDVGVEARINLRSGNLGILVDYSLNPYSHYSGTKSVTLLLNYQDGNVGKRFILNRRANYTRVEMDFTTLFGTLHREGVHIAHIEQPTINEILQEIHSSDQFITALNPKTAGHLARGLTIGNLTQVLSHQPLDQVIATITGVIAG